MLTDNIGCEDLARRWNEEQRTSCGGEEKIGYHLTSSNKKQKTGKGCLFSDTSVIWDYFSNDRGADAEDLHSEEVPLNMAQSVVSLVLFDGDVNVLSCSAIPILGKRPSVTRLLTSEILGRTCIDKRNAGHDMKIQVRDASNNVATGWLEQHYLDRGFTLVNATEFLDVHAVRLQHEVEILPQSNLVGIELNDSGQAKALRGILTKESSVSSEHGIKLSYSTCKISKAGDGGPLFDVDGNFVGMNLFLDTERGAFMQRSVITEKVQQFERRMELLASRSSRCTRRMCNTEILKVQIQSITFPEVMRYKRRSASYPGSKLTNQDLLDEDLDSLGYPKPPRTAVDCGMILINTFEDRFGDTYGSREGKMRVFACSGLIIECNGCTGILTSASLVRNRHDENKIDANLRIDVLLPNKQHTEGILQHYNLHYNVAFVNLKGFGYLPTANIYDPGALISSKVISVGQCFESGILMATRGILTRWHLQSTLDCMSILYSSCEITKAGIGGPVVDFEGKFVGLNFYEEDEGTPFLPQSLIVQIVKHFENKRVVREVDDDGLTNRWPVPKPFWCRPDTRRNEDKE
ncbi:hypothetical protein ACP70R_030835 [Stipagrostis hirtigluma subsp. patula]